jgi:predicted DNA-binding transcriptional regulator YafY
VAVDTATRLLRLLGLLHERPVWRGDELAERLGVTTRTLRRDITRLRDIDYPVEAASGPTGGYQLGRGADVPPLILDDQEAMAVALGLRSAPEGAVAGLEEATVSALAKLERVLPARLQERLRDVLDGTVALPQDGIVPADADKLLVLAQACRRRERVRFMYTSAAGERTLRHADPLRLVHAVRRWYLVAFDLDRDDWRTFRVDRLTAAMATGVACEEREEPDAEALVQEGLTVSPYPIQALVRLHLAASEARRLIPRSVGLLEEEEGGSTTLLRLGGHDPGWLARYLAMMTCRVEVLEPDEVADAFRHHLEVLVGGR